jgi:hypothetical protein
MRNAISIRAVAVMLLVLGASLAPAWAGEARPPAALRAQPVAGCGGPPMGCIEGVCVCPEWHAGCPDCCGDHVCGDTESCASCAADCGVCCGDGACTPEVEVCVADSCVPCGELGEPCCEPALFYQGEPLCNGTCWCVGGVCTGAWPSCL